MEGLFDYSFLSTQYIICECGETFSTEDSLNEHLTKNELHAKKQEIREYQCGLCTKVFTSARSCTYHFKRTHSLRNASSRDKNKAGEKKRYAANIICEVCGKKYASNAALRYHQRVHTGERPYQCPMCPKTFTMPLFLQVHVRTHTGERPYQCSACPKAFSNKAALQRHDRVHTGVKPYACPECGKTFTQSNSMKLHVSTVHLKMPAPYKSQARRNKMKNNVKIYVDSKTNIAYQIDTSKTRIKSKISKDVTVKTIKSLKKELKAEPEEIKQSDPEDEEDMSVPMDYAVDNTKLEVGLEVVDEDNVYQEIIYEDMDKDHIELYEFDDTVNEQEVTYIEEVVVKPEIFYQDIDNNMYE